LYRYAIRSSDVDGFYIFLAHSNIEINNLTESQALEEFLRVHFDDGGLVDKDVLFVVEASDETKASLAVVELDDTADSVNCRKERVIPIGSRYRFT
jgi:hypothetical protein